MSLYTPIACHSHWCTHYPSIAQFIVCAMHTRRVLLFKNDQRTVMCCQVWRNECTFFSSRFSSLHSLLVFVVSVQFPTFGPMFSFEFSVDSKVNKPFLLFFVLFFFSIHLMISNFIRNEQNPDTNTRHHLKNHSSANYRNNHISIPVFLIQFNCTMFVFSVIHDDDNELNFTWW